MKLSGKKKGKSGSAKHTFHRFARFGRIGPTAKMVFGGRNESRKNLYLDPVEGGLCFSK